MSRCIHNVPGGCQRCKDGHEAFIRTYFYDGSRQAAPQEKPATAEPKKLLPISPILAAQRISFNERSRLERLELDRIDRESK